MAIDDNTSYELTGYQVKDLAQKVRAKADSASLASVATSGLYSDLTGAPTIPTVNNGTLTIQQNGTSVGTFTANQSTNATANIETIYSVDVSSTQPVDWTTILNKFHPVGSIYMSATLSTAAQVEAAIGGTWVAWGAGRVPVGVDTSDADFDTAEETGGAKTVTLTVDQIPSHDHEAINWASGYSGGSQAGFKTILEGSSVTTVVKACKAAGGGQSHNNLQPYITCYMYKRTA